MESIRIKDEYVIAPISQFPNKVVSFSSQYGSEKGSYSTNQLIVDRPTVYPRYGDFCEASVLRYYGRWWSTAPSAPHQVGTLPNCYPTEYCIEDYIELEYGHPVYLQKVRIYETFIPGCIVGIYARMVMPDGSPRWQEVWRRSSPSREAHVSRIFEPELTRRPTRPVDRLWLAFNSRLAEYYTEIDTVEIVGSVAETPGFAAVSELCPLVHELQIETPACEQSNDELNNTIAGWFSRWPPELLTRMLGYLDLQSLLRLGQCCRLLQEFTSDPLLYKSVSLRPYCLGLTDSHLQFLGGRVSATRHLELSWCSALSPIYFCDFLRCTAECLSTLRLASCGFLDDSCLQIIASQCKSLVDLDLSSPSSVTNSGYAALSTGLTRLRRLNLYRSEIAWEPLENLIALNPCLQHLNLGACCSLTTYGDQVAVLLGRSCPDLRSLDLWRNRSISCYGLTQLASGCHGLLELDIGWCSVVDSSTGCLAELAQQCRGLQKLFLTANRTVRDVDLLAISKHCKDLRQLDILGTSLVSEDTVHHVLKSCPRLEMFDVSFCGGVKRAYVDSIRDSFPHCAIQMSFQDQR